jgi:hypothetical protein
MVLLLWLPIAAAMMWVSASVYDVSLPLLAALFPLGILVWQLFEYSVHRWLFHFDPVTPEGIKTHFLMHGSVTHSHPACLRIASAAGALWLAGQQRVWVVKTPSRAAALAPSPHLLTSVVPLLLQAPSQVSHGL